MNKKPIRVEIYFYYKCECGAEHQCTFAEVKEIGKYVCNSCGQIVTMEKMTGVVVTPQYIGSGLVKQPRLNQPLPLQKIDDKIIISSLKKIGYTGCQIKSALEEVKYTNQNCNDLGELLQLCVNKLTNGV